MLALVMGAVCLASCGFWIYVFNPLHGTFRDEEKQARAKKSFGTSQGFIQVKGPRSSHVIVLRRPVVPSKRAKTT